MGQTRCDARSCGIWELGTPTFSVLFLPFFCKFEITRPFTQKAFLLHAALRSRSGAGPARWPPASGPPDQLSRPGALRVPRTPVRGSSRASLTLPGANTRTPDPGQALAAPHQAAAPPPSPLGRPKPAGPVPRGPTPPRPPTGRRAAPSLARLTQLPRAAR